MALTNDHLFIGAVVFGITIGAGLSDLNESIFTFGAQPIPYKSSPITKCALLIAVIPVGIFANGAFHHVQ